MSSTLPSFLLPFSVAAVIDFDIYIQSRQETARVRERGDDKNKFST